MNEQRGVPSRQYSRRGVFTIDTISSPEPFNSSSSSFNLFRRDDPREDEESLLKLKDEALEKGENLLTRSDEVVESAGPDASPETVSSVRIPRIGDRLRGWMPSRPKLHSPESSDAAGLGIPVGSKQIK